MVYTFNQLPTGKIDILENGKSISQGGPGYGTDYAKSLGYKDPGTVPTPTTPINTTSLPVGTDPALTKALSAAVDSGNVSSQVAGLLNAYTASSDTQKKYDELSTELNTLQTSQGGEAADTQAAMEQYKIPESFQHVQDLNVQAAQLKGEMDKFDAETQQLKSNIEEQPVTTHVVSGQQSQLMKQRNLTQLAKAAELSSVVGLAQAYQGNIETGLKLAKQSVDLKYAPIQARIDTIKTQLGIVKGTLDREDSKRADVISKLIDTQQKDLDTQKKKETDLNSLGAQAAAAGAPLALIRQAIATGDLIQASALLSQYVHATGEKGLTGSDEEGPTKTFTQTQINKGANALGTSQDAFKTLPYEIQNFFVSSPQGTVTNVQTVLQQIKSGEVSLEEGRKWFDDEPLPLAVRDYLKNQAGVVAPATAQSKPNIVSQIWSTISNFWSGK